jgi:hypothetical protein
MINGRDHASARNGLAVNGRSTHALAEADTTALYGEYEQKLASELAELLKSGAQQRATQHGVAPRAGLALAPAGPDGAKLPPPALGYPSALQQAAPGTPRTFVPAPPPKNDFAAADVGRDPVQFAWRHEPRPAQPGWMARQLKAGLLGLGAGLMVVLPAAAVFSGKLDDWLPSRKPLEVADRAPRLYEVPITPPRMPAGHAITAAAAVPPAESVPVIVPRIETVPSVRQVPVLPVPAEPAEPPAARSVETVEAFPPAATATMPKAAIASVAPARDEAADLLALGQRLVQDGDIAGARTPLMRAANLGNAEALLALGETFDPNMLAAWGALDVKSDASAARLYYGRAMASGSPRAKARLEALN